MGTLTTTTTANIKEENTKNNKNSATPHKGHVCLFIGHVTSSSTTNNNNNNNNNDATDIFMTKKGIVYQRVRLNGILVPPPNEKMKAPCNENKKIWLDDGTGTISVVLSQRLLARTDAPKLIEGVSVTVFGLVKHLNNEFVLQCGGFHVEADASNDMYHEIKLLAIQSSLPQAAAAAAVVDSDADKENVKQHPQKPVVLFQSLSSQPSPPLKDYSGVNIATPEKMNPYQFTSKSTPLHFVWSPEQPIATSTPLYKGLRSVKESPLRPPAINMDQSLIDDDDSFGDINLSFTRIENEAILSKPQKRSWEP